MSLRGEWPREWNRGDVLGAIEEASGVVLSANDPLPDTLIAVAQAEDLSPIDLRLWIYDSPGHPWTADHLRRWAKKLKAVERELGLREESDAEGSA